MEIASIEERLTLRRLLFRINTCGVLRSNTLLIRLRNEVGDAETLLAGIEAVLRIHSGSAGSAGSAWTPMITAFVHRRHTDLHHDRHEGGISLFHFAFDHRLHADLERAEERFNILEALIHIDVPCKTESVGELLALREDVFVEGLHRGIEELAPLLHIATSVVFLFELGNELVNPVEHVPDLPELEADAAKRLFRTVITRLFLKCVDDFLGEAAAHLFQDLNHRSNVHLPAFGEHFELRSDDLKSLLHKRACLFREIFTTQHDECHRCFTENWCKLRSDFCIRLLLFSTVLCSIFLLLLTLELCALRMVRIHECHLLLHRRILSECLENVFLRECAADCLSLLLFFFGNVMDGRVCARSWVRKGATLGLQGITVDHRLRTRVTEGLPVLSSCTIFLPHTPIGFQRLAGPFWTFSPHEACSHPLGAAARHFCARSAVAGAAVIVVEALQIPSLERELVEFSRIKKASGRSFVTVLKGQLNAVLPFFEIFRNASLLISEVSRFCSLPCCFLRSITILSFNHNTLRFQLLECRTHHRERLHRLRSHPVLPCFPKHGIE